MSSMADSGKPEWASSNRRSALQFSGMAALLSTLSISLAALLNLTGPESDLAANGGRSLNFYEALSKGTADGWLAIVGVALALVASWGMFQLLKRRSSPVWMALAATFIGAGFLLLGFIFGQYFSRLLEQHLTAPGTFMRDTLIALTGTSRVTGDLLLVVGSGFLFGLGTGLFGLFSLRAPQVPAWIAWLGMLAGIMHFGWLQVLAPASWAALLGVVKWIDLLLFLIWLTAMGILLLRRPPIPSG